MCELIDKLQRAQKAYTEAVTLIEDSDNSNAKKEATHIIEVVILHETIALETFEDQVES